MALEDEVGKRYLTGNFMVKPLQFSDGSGSNFVGLITAFYNGLARICTPKARWLR